VSTPVKVLVVDPTRGYQREIEAGETPVDGDGNNLLFPGYGPPVADIAGLKAVPAVYRIDQQVRFVEDADPNTPGVDYPSEYAWDAQATEAGDSGSPGRPPAIVVPDDAPATGRWIRVYSEVNPHHETHELGGVDEVKIENLATDVYNPSSSSSSPGPGDPIQVLVPDGGGGVQWVDLNVRIEDSVTDEMGVSKVLQPDGLGGVQWNDPDIEGFTTTEVAVGKVLQPDGAGGLVWNDFDPVIEGDLDMNCNNLMFVDTVYFCGGGGSSSSSGADEFFIRPRRASNQGLEYDAPDGHYFNDEVFLSGNKIHNVGDPALPQDVATKAYVDAQIDANNELSEILLNGNDAECQTIENLAGVYFCDFGSSSSGGSSGPTDLWIRPDFDTAQQLEYHATGGHRFESPVFFNGTVTTNDNNIYVGTGGVGRDGAVLTFAAGGTGKASFAGAIDAADAVTIENASSPTLNLKYTAGPHLAVSVDVGQAYVGTVSNHTLYLQTNVTTGLSIDTSQNVSIPNGDLQMGANYIGNNSQALRFAATSGNATFSGVVDVPVGTAAAPTLTFRAADTGFYGSSFASVAAAAYGVEVCRFTSSDGSDPQVQAVDGAVAEPAYSFVSDSDTGIYRIGAGQLGFAADGGLVLAMSAVVVTVDSDVEVSGYVETDDAFYLGDPDTDGSWRVIRDGADLVFERRDGGIWNECDRMGGCSSSSSP